MQKHVSDTRRARGSITNQFPDPKNPHLESKIIKIGLETPEIWFTNTDAVFLGHSEYIKVVQRLDCKTLYTRNLKMYAW